MDSLSQRIRFSIKASRYSRICYAGKLITSWKGKLLFFHCSCVISDYPIISCLSISFSPFPFLNSHLEYSFKTTAKRLNWRHALPASCLLQQPKNPESQAVPGKSCISNSSRLQGGVLKPFFSFLLFLSHIFSVAASHSRPYLIQI